MQQRIDATLRETTSSLLQHSPAALVAAIEYSLFAPGKRLRPLLTLLACEATDGNISTALPAACAVEMVHTYSLIHDDLPAMDDDDLRRGQPTCHKKFGEVLGILAGDALLTLAFEVIGQGCEPILAAVSSLELARGAGASGMVGGQVLDLQASGDLPVNGSDLASEHGLESIHRAKTGALFRSALRMGVHASQADRNARSQTDELEWIDRYAQAFGLAFQVTDDLLDVESSADRTGKNVGKDAGRGKVTYPGLLGVPASRDKAKSLVEQAQAAANALGPRAEPLAELAHYLMQRDR